MSLKAISEVVEHKYWVVKVKNNLYACAPDTEAQKKENAIYRVKSLKKIHTQRARTNFYLLNDEELDTIAKFGAHSDLGELAINIDDQVSRAQMRNEYPHLVEIDWSNHSISDENGEPLPWGMYFDYMNGNINNGSYNLEKALDILKSRDDIFFKDSAEIKQVPYYNNRKGCSFHLEFFWKASVESYRKMERQNHTYDSTYPEVNRYRSVFDLDLLGLRAGGAARYDTFYPPYNDDDDDDED